MKSLFPRTEVAGISLPRMLMGSNWLAGWSHQGLAADKRITEQHSNWQSIAAILDAYLDHGIDAMMAPFGSTPLIVRAIRETEQKRGEKIIMIDTPGINVGVSKSDYAEAQATIKQSRELGATFCLIHHGSAEQLVNRRTRQIERIDDYTGMIRDNQMLPGLSAHMPELIVYSDENDYDVETYIQIYNCTGFLMQVEIETINRIIRNAKKPVMTIKPMAAGRVTPFVGLNFVWATIRDCDMVTVGCFHPREVEEDVEISLAALERRAVNIGVRSSPIQEQAAFGK